jgi:uncharacterized damage-inducible protein DinB
MSEIARILDQMDRAISGDAWHGPSLMSLLDGVSAADAQKHAVRGAHSIWELVNHIAAWNGIMQREMEGETVDVTGEHDWPPVRDTSEAAWKKSLANLKESRAKIRKTVERLRDDQLDEIPVPRTQNTRYLMLHGLVQHDLYHAGQIAILKKAVA